MHLEETISRCLASHLDHLAVVHFPMDLDSIVKQAYEKAVTRYVFKRCHQNQVNTAKVLGVNRNTLRKRLFNYHIVSHEVRHESTADCRPQATS